jgi:uncharacterized membrane protein
VKTEFFFREVHMESKAKLAGHPVHQMLVVFPLGLLATAVVFDILTAWLGNPQWSQAAFYMIGAGVVGGLAAAVFGLIDWLDIPAGTRAKAIGAWHGLGNVVVVLLFAASWMLRYNSTANQPDGAAMTFSVVGVALALVTGWLGGELVDRLGIGIDDGANVNAPSSLRSRARVRERQDRAA